MRYDTQRMKWYLQYCYESLHVDGPFHSNQAPAWFSAKRSFLFDKGCARGTLGASDPGFRTPHTVYDFSTGSFVDVMDDFLPELTKKYQRVQKAEDWYANPSKNPRVQVRDLCQSIPPPSRTQAQSVHQYLARCKRRLQKKCDNKKRKQRSDVAAKKLRSRTFVRPTFVRPTLRGIRKAWDQIRAMTRDAHNITANYFVSQFDTFALPEFMTRNMIKKRRLKLGLPLPRFALGETNDPSRPAPSIDLENVGSYLHKTTRVQAARYGHFANRQRIIAKFQSDPYLRKHIHIGTEGNFPIALCCCWLFC